MDKNNDYLSKIQMPSKAHDKKSILTRLQQQAQDELNIATKAQSHSFKEMSVKLSEENQKSKKEHSQNALDLFKYIDSVKPSASNSKNIEICQSSLKEANNNLKKFEEEKLERKRKKEAEVKREKEELERYREQQRRKEKRVTLFKLVAFVTVPILIILSVFFIIKNNRKKYAESNISISAISLSYDEFDGYYHNSVFDFKIKSTSTLEISRIQFKLTLTTLNNDILFADDVTVACSLSPNTKQSFNVNLYSTNLLSEYDLETVKITYKLINVQYENGTFKWYDDAKTKNMEIAN